MGVKDSNEITVKIKGSLVKFYKLLEDKGYVIKNEFSLDDTYFIPADLSIDNIPTREILAKAVLVRNIVGKTSKRVTKKITFKRKEIDEGGNILSQDAIDCGVLEIEDAKRLLSAIGYKEIMNIREEDVDYEKDGFLITVKDINDGEKLIEVETSEDEEFDTIEKIKRRVLEEGIPIYTEDYFVKKAEIELNKVLGR